MAERVFESGDAPALSPDRHEIVVHDETEVHADGRAGRCEIERRTAIAAETARRLCCDADIVPVVDGPNGEPLSVGRRTRSIPPEVRRAPAASCGCEHSRRRGSIPIESVLPSIDSGGCAHFASLPFASEL